MILYYKIYSKLNLYSYKNQQKQKICSCLYSTNYDKLSLDYPGSVRWQHFTRLTFKLKGRLRDLPDCLLGGYPAERQSVMRDHNCPRMLIDCLRLELYMRPPRKLITPYLAMHGSNSLVCMIEYLTVDSGGQTNSQCALLMSSLNVSQRSAGLKMSEV